MSEFTPPGTNQLITNSRISVTSVAFFEGDTISQETAVANAQAEANLDNYVSGYTEPHHRLTSHVGTERVEDGSTITDHVVAMPARLTLKGQVSDITSPFGGEAGTRAWIRLKNYHKAETILSVITEWYSYRNMVIRSIDSTQTNRGMEFTLELQEVVRVGVGNFRPSPRKGPAKDRQPNVASGQQSIIGYTGTDAQGQTRFFQFLGPGQEGGFQQLPGTIETAPDGTVRLVTDEQASSNQNLPPNP